jgi:hypothetical protein
MNDRSDECITMAILVLALVEAAVAITLRCFLLPKCVIRQGGSCASAAGTEPAAPLCALLATGRPEVFALEHNVAPPG